jgi:hypothetical protein
VKGRIYYGADGQEDDEDLATNPALEDGLFLGLETTMQLLH